MFNVGGGEVIVILLLALIVLGPDKLPNAAKQAGKYLGEFRRMSQGFQDEIKQAMDLEGLTSTTPRRMEPTRNASAPPVAAEPTNDPGPVVDPDAPTPPPAPVDAVTTVEDARPGTHAPTPASSSPDIVVEGPSGSFS